MTHFYGNNDHVVTNAASKEPTAIPSGALHEVSPSRLNSPKGRPDMVSVGVWVWLSSELMFFAALFAAYFMLRNTTNELAASPETAMWYTESSHHDVTFASINTAILVLSSFFCQFAANAASAGRVNGSWVNPMKMGMRQGFIITAFLGTVFISGQVWEYFNLFSEGFTIQTNQYWSAFFLATGFHGLHVPVSYTHLTLPTSDLV